MNNKIKISEAKRIAKENDYDMVIIIGIQKDKSGWTTTYGKNQAYCNIAGHLGQKKIVPFVFGDDGILANFDYESDIKEDVPKFEKSD